MQEQEQATHTAEVGGIEERPADKGPASGDVKAVEDNSAETRIFTQKDVDHIVQQRLATEKAKAAALLQQKEQAFRERELNYQARDTLNARGLPVELLEVLDYTNEQGFATALDKLDQIMTQRLQQSVEDRLRPTELPKVNNGSTARSGPDVRSAFGLIRKE